MLTKIGYRVDDKTREQMEELKSKERWSMAKLSLVAMEYYLKLRGMK